MNIRRNLVLLGALLALGSAITGCASSTSGKGEAVVITNSAGQTIALPAAQPSQLVSIANQKARIHEKKLDDGDVTH